MISKILLRRRLRDKDQETKINIKNLMGPGELIGLIKLWTDNQDSTFKWHNINSKAERNTKQILKK